MNIICVIPARAESTRFFEKPLAKILGKPMIQWVWEHCMEVTEFSEVYVATDSDKIKDTVEAFGGKVIMTSSDHDTATERLWEVSHKVEADLYVMVNGDEPLLTREAIIQCIPSSIEEGALYVSNLMTDFSNPVEVVDATNLKIVTDANDRCLFISRSPIPYPKGTWITSTINSWASVHSTARLSNFITTPHADRSRRSRRTTHSASSRTECPSTTTTAIARVSA